VGCAVTVEFHRRDGTLAFHSVEGRWSSQPEPLRRQPVTGVPNVQQFLNAPQPAVQVTLADFYDPALAAASRRLDISAEQGGEEVAVAVLKSDGTAFAWGAESYAFAGWAKSDWQLELGTVYYVTVRVEGSGVHAASRFELPFLAGDFSKFTLSP